MPFIASVEVDQRQNFIQEADTLREMLGASRIIEYSIQIAEEELKAAHGARLFWPVSGVLKFHAENSGILAEFLARYRERLEEISLTASIGVIESKENLEDDLRTLDRKVRRRKDGKAAGLTLPSLPYFAPCRILPHLPANHWNPGEKQQDRRLRSWQAKEREDYQNQNRNPPLFGMRIPYKQLPELKDLVDEQSDSYLGILKGDVDGLGKLLAKLRYSELAKQPELNGKLREDLPASAGAAYCFCLELEETVEQSILDAYGDVHPPPRQAMGERWPFRHLMVAGDDVLILSRRELALELVYKIGERLARNVSENLVLTAALRCAGIGPEDQPSISFGTLFTKAGYPADASFDLAEELLKSAKKRRSESKDEVGGFVDFHWLGDSARPHLKAIRQSSYFYRDDGGDGMWLTTLPWGMSVLDRHIQGAGCFRKLPRRKLKQLDEIARLGKGLSELAFRGWWQGLRKKESNAITEGLEKISWSKSESGPPAFWRVETRDGEKRYETCFLDLVELTEVTER